LEDRVTRVGTVVWGLSGMRFRSQDARTSLAPRLRALFLSIDPLPYLGTPIHLQDGRFHSTFGLFLLPIAGHVDSGNGHSTSCRHISFHLRTGHLVYEYLQQSLAGRHSHHKVNTPCSNILIGPLLSSRSRCSQHLMRKDLSIFPICLFSAFRRVPARKRKGRVIDEFLPRYLSCAACGEWVP